MSRRFPSIVTGAPPEPLEKHESVTSYVDGLDGAETLDQHIEYNKRGDALNHVNCGPAAKLQLEMKRVLDTVVGLTMEGSVQLRIRHSDNRIHIITVDVSDTIAYVKAIIKRDENIPINQQCLIYTGKQVTHSHTLLKCYIKNDKTFHLIWGLPGNM